MNMYCIYFPCACICQESPRAHSSSGVKLELYSDDGLLFYFQSSLAVTSVEEEGVCLCAGGWGVARGSCSMLTTMTTTTNIN